MNPVKLLRGFNISTNNSEPENTVEQVASGSDQIAVGYEHTTQNSNSSKQEDTELNVRTLDANPGILRPERKLRTERTSAINCKHPDTTCIAVLCSLNEPIGRGSRAVVSLKMLADFENLGEFTFSSLLKLGPLESVSQTDKLFG
jgi:hypothetical protein